MPREPDEGAVTMQGRVVSRSSGICTSSVAAGPSCPFDEGQVFGPRHRPERAVVRAKPLRRRGADQAAHVVVDGEPAQLVARRRVAHRRGDRRWRCRPSRGPRSADRCRHRIGGCPPRPRMKVGGRLESAAAGAIGAPNTAAASTETAASCRTRNPVERMPSSFRIP